MRNPDLAFDPTLRRWTVAGYASAREVLRGACFGSDNRVAAMLRRLETGGHEFPALRRLLPAITFFLDPPEHGAARRLLVRLLSHQPLSALQPRFAELAAATLAEVRPDRGFDLVQDFARPLAHRFIGLILGFGPRETEALAADSEQLIELLELVLPLRRYRALDGCAASMLERVGALIAERRVAPQADSISAILPIAAAEGVSDDRLAAFCVFLFMAGVETTLSSISGTARLLLADAEAILAVRADRTVLPKLADALLRLHSAVHKVARTALDAVTVGGEAIAPGTGLTILIADANRDPDQYPAPGCPMLDQIGGPPHLAFGERAHYCLGAQHARALTVAALGALLDLPDLRLLSEQEQWADRGTVRSLVRLPVTCGEMIT